MVQRPQSAVTVGTQSLLEEVALGRSRARFLSPSPAVRGDLHPVSFHRGSPLSAGSSPLSPSSSESSPSPTWTRGRSPNVSPALGSFLPTSSLAAGEQLLQPAGPVHALFGHRPGGLHGPPSSVPLSRRPPHSLSPATRISLQFPKHVIFSQAFWLCLRASSLPEHSPSVRQLTSHLG